MEGKSPPPAADDGAASFAMCVSNFSNPQPGSIGQEQNIAIGQIVIAETLFFRSFRMAQIVLFMVQLSV